MTKKIKTGLLLDGYELPQWAYVALERVILSAHTEIRFIVINPEKKARKTMFAHFVYRAFDKLDRFLFKRAINYSDPHTIKSLVKDIPIRTLAQISATDATREAVDVILDLGSFHAFHASLARHARYGVWYYQLGEYAFNRGGPAGFWEAVTRRPYTGVTLLAHLPKQSRAVILEQSSVMTKYFKPTLNKPQLHFRAAALMSRQIERLARLGEPNFFKQIQQNNTDLDFFSYPRFNIPENTQALLILIQYLWYMAGRVLRRLFYFEHWYLYYDIKPDIATNLYQFTRLMPSKKSFWADPMLLYAHDTYYIFFEELIYRTNKGHISVIEMDQNGQQISEPKIVLEKDYHLSYPFVFKHQDKYYMLPESVQNHTIELYESTQFPLQWQHKMNLMENVNAVDSTLFYYQNKWWLFTAMEDVSGSSFGDELYLFWSEELFTQNWTAHPLNPIVSDVRTARPAGKIFIRDGKIYRPSQDCSVRYGHCTHINEITCLSETDYRERIVSTIRPNWDKQVLGTHTLVHAHNMTMVDAYYYCPKYW